MRRFRHTRATHPSQLADYARRGEEVGYTAGVRNRHGLALTALGIAIALGGLAWAITAWGEIPFQ